MDPIRSEIHDAARALGDAEAHASILIAEPLAARPWIRIAKSTRGYVAVLPEVAGAMQPDLMFAHLRVQFNVLCTLRVRGQTRSERLTLIECTSDERRLQDCFLDVLAIALPEAREVDADAYRRSIEELAELFAAIQRAEGKAALGLWGELFIMSEARDLAFAAGTWHSQPGDRWDFASAGLRIEVKTTTGYRAHHFSLEQLRPSGSPRVVVASVLTTASVGGPSIQELVDEVCSGLDHDAQSRVRSVAMRSLGKGWQSDSETRFDREVARATVEWFDAHEIPAIDEAPASVTEVRFKSDLNGVIPLAQEDIARTDPLGLAILPPSHSSR